MFQLNEFAARLKAIRIELGLSQDALAKKLNVSRVALSYYENGQRTPDIEFLYNLQQVTGYPFEYLMCVSEAKEAKNIYASQELGLNDKALSLIMKRSAYINDIVTYSSEYLDIFLSVFFNFISGAVFIIRTEKATHDPANDIAEWINYYNMIDRLIHESLEDWISHAKEIGYARSSENERNAIRNIVKHLEDTSPQISQTTDEHSTGLKEILTFMGASSWLIKDLKRIEAEYRKNNIPSET